MCDAEYASISREYCRRGALSSEERVELLASRLLDYEAGVYRCAVPDVGATVAAAIRARGKSCLLRAASFPEAWLPSGYRFPFAHGLSYEELDKSEGVISACAAAIASTGTIVLSHGPQDARRAMTLIPDYHLCVVLTEQVVETVPEGFARLRGLESGPLTTVSGPSATADIEMTRVKGVHGPRFLDVILAG